MANAKTARRATTKEFHRYVKKAVEALGEKPTNTYNAKRPNGVMSKVFLGECNSRDIAKMTSKLMAEKGLYAHVHATKKAIGCLCNAQ